MKLSVSIFKIFLLINMINLRLAVSTEIFPRTFAFEALSPQKIVVGCRGTQFGNGRATSTFYIIDANGHKKYVEPGHTISVTFPTDTISDNSSHLNQSLPNSIDKNVVKEVPFHEICFPNECNSPTCGFTIGPLPAHGSFTQSSITQTSSHNAQTVHSQGHASISSIICHGNMPGCTNSPSSSVGSTSSNQAEVVSGNVPDLENTPDNSEMPPRPPPGGGMCNCCQMCQMPGLSGGATSGNMFPNFPSSNFPSSNPSGFPQTGFFPNWPFGKELFLGNKVSKTRTDAEYYAALPGSIRGSPNIIYYPSCETDAYIQPAILNYCPQSLVKENSSE